MILSLIAECDRIRDELEALKARAEKAEAYVEKLKIDISGHKGVICEQVDHIHRLQDGLASARAVAMEECARLAVAQPYFPDTDIGKRQEWVKLEIAEKISRLAPLPSGFVLVPKEVVEQVKAALDLASDWCCDGEGDSDHQTHEQKCPVGRALSALEALR